VVSVTPQPPFTTGERTPVTIGYEAGWAPELVSMQRLEEKSFAPARDRIPDVQYIVTFLTELPWLQFIFVLIYLPV
jgi:hypothetical protein